MDQLIQKTLKTLNCSENFKVYPIWKNWQKIVGETIASKSEPAFVRGTTLIVFVESSVWMNELEIQKHSLVRKVKEELSLDFSLQDIRFQMKTH